MRALYCILIGLITSATAFAAEPATEPARPILPELKPEIQAQMQSSFEVWTKSPNDAEAWFTEMGKQFALKNRLRVSHEVWLIQILGFASRADAGPFGKSAVAVRMSQYSQILFDIPPVMFPYSLGPYVERGDPEISALALNMIGAARVFEPELKSKGILNSPLQFASLTPYLLQLKQRNADPPWKIIKMMYQVHPEAGLNTAVEAYLDRDERVGVVRSQKELTILLLSLDLADETRKPALQQQALAKLREMAASPHWCVRAYVAQMGRQARWIEDQSMFDKLEQDETPLVRELASRE